LRTLAGDAPTQKPSRVRETSENHLQANFGEFPFRNCLEKLEK